MNEVARLEKTILALVRPASIEDGDTGQVAIVGELPRTSLEIAPGAHLQVRDVVRGCSVDGRPEGAATFTTVTMTLAETSLPDESLALKTTVVAPTLKEDGALLVPGTAPSIASAAVAPLRNEAIWNCVAGTAREPFDETTIGAGADSCGGCASTTAS